MKIEIEPMAFAVPTPVWVIGTYDKEGKPNAMTAAWGGICCSKPPCVGISVQKVRHTFDSINLRKAFTVNVPSEDYAQEADYFGIGSGKSADKFAATGLTAVKSNLVDAPYVDEFPLILECKVVHAIEIGIHTLFVGEIVGIKADEAVLGEKDLPDIEKVHPIVYTPEVRTYYGIGRFIGKAFAIGKKFGS